MTTNNERTIMEAERLWHKRLSDFEVYDRIEFKVIPRYKTSGLSGDEWRQHVEVTFFFKGKEVKSFGCRDMQIALALAGGRVITWSDEGIADEILAMEKAGLCDQPSCEKPSVGRLRIKEEFGDRGEKLEQKEGPSGYYRQFCKTHIRRGDCSREDSDDNYIPLDGVDADASSNLMESPSAFGGVFKMPEP